MSSYRLLRSNKETGPYSQEQIIGLGFKPYDLIWVDGKSAGWRYPSEIPELKAYAPVVEEQPYDRFFKKPVVPPRGTPLPETLLAAALSATEQDTFSAEPARPAYTPASLQVVGKHIHVTLPSGNTLNVTTVSGRKEPVADKSVLSVSDERKPSFAETISAIPLTPVTETMPAVNAGQLADNSDHEAVSYYAAPASSRMPWTTLVGLVIGIATLVGLGIMIGLSINRAKPQLAQSDAATVPETQQAVTPAVTTEPAGNPTTTATISPDKTVPVASATTPGPVTPVPAQSGAPVSNRKDVVAARTRPVSKKELTQPAAKPLDKPSTTVAVAKEPVVVHPRAEAIPAANLEKQVNLVTNSYKVGAFGGISGLQCTVVNDSKVALETVEVEVQYVQANDKVYKTETLSFRDVAAGGQMTLSAPKSSRGIKIVSRIVKINSREPGLAGITVKS